MRATARIHQMSDKLGRSRRPRAMTVTRSNFQTTHKDGIRTNDQQVQQRLQQAGVDGKKLLEGADTNRDGKVHGTEELNRLFNGVDDLDRDGSRNTITD